MQLRASAFRALVIGALLLASAVGGGWKWDSFTF